MVSFPNSKINLGLAILEKRTDGYHDIESCFYPVNWCDALEIIVAPTTQFTSSGISIPGSSESNLCLKVYASLKEKFDIPDVHIHLHKNIPIGAGMGGGSSDAAFTAKMLNEIFSLNLSEDQLEELVRPLGSDCAFFIRNKPVIAFNKGDVFSPCSISLKGYALGIVYPSIHISTKEAYSGVIPAVPAQGVLQKIEKPIGAWKNSLMNDFENSIFPNHPTLKSIKDKLYALGAVYASMTGSGSAVYGIFEHQIDLKNHFPSSYFYWEGVMD